MNENPDEKDPEVPTVPETSDDSVASENPEVDQDVSEELEAEPGSYEEGPNDPQPEQTDNSPRPEDGDQEEVTQDSDVDYSLDSLDSDS